MRHPRHTAQQVAAEAEASFRGVDGVRGVYVRTHFEVVVTLDSGALQEQDLAEASYDFDTRCGHRAGAQLVYEDAGLPDPSSEKRRRDDYPVLERGYLLEVEGDACQPERARDPLYVDVIAHSCNDVGAWGRGFVLALDRRFGPRVREVYQASRRTLGDYCLADVGDRFYVANIVAQRGLPSPKNRQPFRVTDFIGGLCRVRNHFRDQQRVPIFHMPRAGSGYGGVPWAQTRAQLTATAETQGLRIRVYAPGTHDHP